MADHDAPASTIPHRPRGSWRTALLLGALCAGLAGCVNSRFLVGLFYDRAADKGLDAAAEWIDATPAQRDELAAYLGTVHTWHRRDELPRYAALIRDMTAGLSTYDQATPADFQRWFDMLEQRVLAVRACHPARFATPLTRTLSDAQVQRMETRWREARAKRREQAGNETRPERIARRVENIATWSGRLGFEFDDRQVEMLRQAFVDQVSMSDRYREVNTTWNERLFDILREQDAPDHDDALDAHVADWFGLLERAYPEDWQRNREHWRDFAIAFEKTLSKRQRRDALRWIDKLADSLAALSRAEPDWTAQDPAYGCMVGTDLTGGAASGDDV